MRILYSNFNSMIAIDETDSCIILSLFNIPFDDAISKLAILSNINDNDDSNINVAEIVSRVIDYASKARINKSIIAISNIIVSFYLLISSDVTGTIIIFKKPIATIDEIAEIAMKVYMVPPLYIDDFISCSSCESMDPEKSSENRIVVELKKGQHRIKLDIDIEKHMNVLTVANNVHATRQYAFVT